MKAAFVLNRAMRKTLRVVTPKRHADNEAHTDLTEHFRRDYYNDTYHNQNLYTMEYDADEFGDYDDELEGLTIVECSGEAELFEFCTGYNI